MNKLVKVVKADGSQHFAALSAKVQLEAQNNLLPEGSKWTITVVPASEAKGHSFKAKDFVAPGDAGKVIKLKDDRIAELEKQLADARAGAKKNVDETVGLNASPASNSENAKPYKLWNKADLTAEIEKRVAAGRTIDISEAKTNKELVAKLEEDDAAAKA